MFNLIFTNLANFFQHAVNNVFNAIMEKDIFSLLLSGLAKNDVEGNVVYIPGLSNLANLLRVIGWIIFGISVMLFLLQTMGLVKQNKNPIGNIIRIVIAAFLIMNSDVIYKAISSMTTSIYTLFTSIWTGKSTVGDELIKLTLSADVMENFMQFCFMLAISIAMLGSIVSYLERVILLCIYIYFYPVALGFSACEDGMETFIDWIKGVFSQVFAILLSYALIYMAMTAATKGTTSGIDLGVISIDVSLDFLNIVKDTSMIVSCVIAVILFNASKDVEKILAMFQIKTMKIGDAGRSLEQAFNQAKMQFTTIARVTGASLGRNEIPSAVTENILHQPAMNLGQKSNGAMKMYSPMTTTKEKEDERPATFMEQQAKHSADFASINNMYQFNKDGKMEKAPDKKIREQMAVESGIIQPATTGMQIMQRKFPILTAQGREDSKRMKEFNNLMDGYALDQFNMKQNFQNNLSQKNIHPTIKNEDGSTRIMTYKDVSEAINLPSIKDFRVDKGASVGWQDEKGNFAYQISGTDTRTGKKESYIIGQDSGTGINDFKVTSITDIKKNAGRNENGEIFNKQLSRGEAHRDGGFTIDDNLYAYKLDKIDSYAFVSDARTGGDHRLQKSENTYAKSVSNKDWSAQYSDYKHIDYSERGMGVSSKDNVRKKAVNKTPDLKKDSQDIKKIRDRKKSKEDTNDRK